MKISTVSGNAECAEQMAKPESLEEFIAMREDLRAAKSIKKITQETRRHIRRVAGIDLEIEVDEAVYEMLINTKEKQNIPEVREMVDEAIRKSDREIKEQIKEESRAMNRREERMFQSVVRELIRKGDNLGVDVRANMPAASDVRVKKLKDGIGGGYLGIHGIQIGETQDDTQLQHVMYHEIEHWVGARKRRVTLNQGGRMQREVRGHEVPEFLDEAIVTTGETEMFLRLGGSREKGTDYVLNRYVLGQMCLRIAQEKGVQVKDVLEYMQRGMLLGNGEYALSLIRETYGEGMIDAMERWGPKPVYTPEMEKDFRQYEIPILNVDWEKYKALEPELLSALLKYSLLRYNDGELLMHDVVREIIDETPVPEKRDGGVARVWRRIQKVVTGGR